jgi:type VI protein secretion system component Hcp
MAIDSFLKIKSINGGVTRKDFVNYIEVTSFSWTESREIETPGAARGLLNVGGLTLVSPSSKASPRLAQAVVQGTLFDVVTLTVEGKTPKGSAMKELFLKMEEAIVSSFSFQGSNAGNTPLDRYVINFNELTITDGGVSVKLDFRPT